jgi:putative transposase
MPLGLAVGSANTHNQKLFVETFDNLPARRPARFGRPQHMCLDQGYDSDAIRSLFERGGDQMHLRSRGQERSDNRTRGKGARRWVVKRLFSWLNRDGRILVRWEKKVQNYEALSHQVFAHIFWRNS